MSHAIDTIVVTDIIASKEDTTSERQGVYVQHSWLIRKSNEYNTSYESHNTTRWNSNEIESINERKCENHEITGDTEITDTNVSNGTITCNSHDNTIETVMISNTVNN